MPLLVPALDDPPSPCFARGDLEGIFQLEKSSGNAPESCAIFKPSSLEDISSILALSSAPGPLDAGAPGYPNTQVHQAAQHGREAMSSACPAPGADPEGNLPDHGVSGKQIRRIAQVLAGYSLA